MEIVHKLDIFFQSFKLNRFYSKDYDNYTVNSKVFRQFTGKLSIKSSLNGPPLLYFTLFKKSLLKLEIYEISENYKKFI